ncbi:MgtC/SapB family protein [Candidatus Uhrbacteria bacterium]|nr:MgtC/SapB family protein [Candidatus Uhrbacteria bacterium]
MELSTQEIIIRLVIATVLSGLIGIERELREKPAGVRTNALIGLGSAVMALVGAYAYALWPETTDPTRLASIVVQGVGFLGAGAIIQAAGSVRGLTTAATMWVVAGIGIAAGLGLYVPAFATAGIVLVLLVIFGPLDARLMGTEEERERRGGWLLGGKSKKK